nr:hypothetical protein [uncultured Flavobacterium sp.]
MTNQIFETEGKMQEWLSATLKTDDCFSNLIINKDYYDELEFESLVENKILKSYQHCLSSLELVTVISEDENISLKEGDILRPDFLLYAPETESIVIVELKNLVSPSRQVGTEVSAYASEIKSYIPFISDGDIINVIISPVWTTLIKHYVFHEIFWLQRNIICLEPCEINGKIHLKILDISSLIDDEISLKLSSEHLGGYQICLYDYNLYSDKKDRTRYDPYIEQMKTAIASMTSKGNAQKNHGFAFLWKDHRDLSLAPYSITILNFAPFNSLERLFHDENFEPNEMVERFINIVKEYSPEGHGNSLEQIFNTGEKFLVDFCNPRVEGFTTWNSLRDIMIQNSTLISFNSWGIFAELFSEKLYNEYKKGNKNISSTNPELGLQLINELVDPNYEFYNLSYYDYNPDDEDTNDY